LSGGPRRPSYALKMPRLLITGGTGFIGSHLVQRSLARGYQVTVLSRRSDFHSCIRAKDLDMVEFVSGSADIFSKLGIDLGQFEAVFHLAGTSKVSSSVDNPKADFDCTLRASISLLEELRKLKRRPALIFSSSAAVYGKSTDFPYSEESTACPVSPYGVSKLAVERYIEVYSQLYGLPAASVRPFSVYGPRQCKQVIFDLFQKLLRNPNRLEVLGDGRQLRDFVFVDDVVSAFFTVLENSPLDGSVYNVGSGEHVSISQLTEAVSAAAGLTPRIEYTGSTRPGDAEHLTADISKLRSIGYDPKIPLACGLEKTFHWLCQNGFHLAEDQKAS